MTRVRVDDLPPKLRAQVLAAAEAEPERKGKKRDRRVLSGAGSRFRCRTCGAEFPRYGKKAEDHADAHGGARLEAIWP